LFSFLKSIFSQNIKQFTTNNNFEHLLEIDLLNLYNLYNKEQICVSVCPSMHTNCGHFKAKPITDARRAALVIHFPRKVTSGQVTEEKVMLLIHFYGKIFHYRVYSLIEIEGVRITLDLTKFLCYD
jgi:hypothetical protein